MNNNSQSIASRLGRMQYAIEGAHRYAKDLPKGTVVAADALAKQHVAIRTADAAQEQAKRDFTMRTRQLGELARSAESLRMQLVRLAESEFGPRDPRMREFRPATQGRHRKLKPVPAKPAPDTQPK